MHDTIHLQRYKLSDEASTLRVKRLYFFWVCPDTTAFEWFADLLRTVEDQVRCSLYRMYPISGYCFYSCRVKELMTF